MNNHVEQTPENKSFAVSNEDSQVQNGGESTSNPLQVGLVNNQPISITQRALQKAANNSPRVLQLKAFQEMANTHAASIKSPIQKKGNNTGLPKTTAIQAKFNNQSEDRGVQLHDHEYQQLAVSVESNTTVQRAEVDQEAAVNRGFLTKPGQDSSPGQLDKSAFLSQLKAKTILLADGILSKIGQTSQGCPYIDKWFAYYGQATEEQIEKAIVIFAASTKSAQSASEVITLILERIASSLEAQVAEGLDVVEESNPTALTSDGKMVTTLTPPDVAQLGTSELAKNLKNARKNFRKNPNQATYLEWDKAKREYGQKYGRDKTWRSHNKEYNNSRNLFPRETFVRHEAREDSEERKVREIEKPLISEDESDAMGKLVTDSSKLNKYLTRGPKADVEDSMEELFDQFSSGVKKLGPSKRVFEDSQANRAPGMDETKDVSTLVPDRVYEDPIIRFYGEGLVAGTYLVRVYGIEVYDFTNEHNNAGYDESVAGDKKEEQLVTLPGTRLRYIGQKRGRGQTILEYQFVSGGSQ